MSIESEASGTDMWWYEKGYEAGKLAVSHEGGSSPDAGRLELNMEPGTVITGGHFVPASRERAAALPRDLRLRREKLGELLRDLEVIVSNYHSDGWRTQNESDAALFAEWQQIRGVLFDALTDMTHEIAALRAAAPQQEERTP